MVVAATAAWWHHDDMAVKITIEDVPEEVRDNLARRAASTNKSMQEFLLGELERIASPIPSPELMGRIRKHREESGTRITVDEILQHRDADRK